MSQEPRKILLVFAMEEEAKPTIETLGLKPCVARLHHGIKLYSGEVKRRNSNFLYYLVSPGKNSHFGSDGICRVGTQYAAITAVQGIGYCEPEMVINVGTAGGFKPYCAIGDSFLCSNFVYHDRRIPLPGYDWFGVGGFETGCLCQFPGFRNATVSTGNSLDITNSELVLLSKLAEEVPLLKDMEAAAIAEVCKDFTPPIPFVALKSVTDIVNGDRTTGDQFLRNLQIATNSVCIALVRFLIALDDVSSGSFYSVRNTKLIERILDLRQKVGV